jgi:manganese/zinc/iron transport system permease protein
VDLFFDHTVRTVALGAAVLGIVAGALGSFAVLRRQSLLGDAMSHAALPGIALGYLLTQSKEPIVLLAGAIVAGWIGTFLVTAVVRTTRVKYDASLGIVLSVFFGFGRMPARPGWTGSCSARRLRCSSGTSSPWPSSGRSSWAPPRRSGRS